MKRLYAVCLALVLLLGMGCSGKKNEALRIAAPKGPAGIGLAYLAGEEGYALEVYDAPDVVVAKFISGEADVACVPMNLASILYQKLARDVVLLNVTTLGVLYILDNENSIQSIADLAGKTIYAIGQGATPEYILNYILAKNGLTGQVTIEYVVEHAALAAMVASGEVEIAMLSEPNVSAVLAKSENVRVALDLTKEWSAVSDTELAQGCAVVRRGYYEANKGKIERLLEDYAASVARVLSDPEAPERVASLEFLPSAALAAKAIPNCHIVFITGERAKVAVQNMLQTLYAADPASVGGALPDDDFYALD